MSQIGFSIWVEVRSSLILFVCHLLLVASWSSIVSFPPLCPIWCRPLSFCGHLQRWLGWWLLRLRRYLACLLGCSQFRPPLHHLAFSKSISPCFLLEHGIHDFVFSWYCLFYQFVSQFEPKLARCRFLRVCSFPNLSTEVFHHYCALKSPSLLCGALVFLKSHRRHCRSYFCLLLSMMSLVHYL